MSVKTNTPNTAAAPQPVEPAAPAQPSGRHEARWRKSFVALSAAVLAACGIGDKEASDHAAAASSASVEASAPAVPTAELPAPVPTTAAPATTEAAPVPSLQEQMTAKAETAAVELTGSILELAQKYPDGAYVEEAGGDGSKLQHVQANVTDENGLVTSYHMYVQLHNVDLEAMPENIESLTLEVSRKDANETVLDTPFYLNIGRGVDSAWYIQANGTGEAGPWGVYGDFTENTQVTEGYRLIDTLENEQRVIDQAKRVMEQAANLQPTQGELPPF